MDFKEGDVVQLKSGGLAMTVESTNKIDAGWYADCVFFDGPNFKRLNLATVTLQAYTPPPEGVKKIPAPRRITSPKQR